MLLANNAQNQALEQRHLSLYHPSYSTSPEDSVNELLGLVL